MYQIDQSGKIEQTSKSTVIAVSNGKSLSILISAKEKRRLEKIFRLAGKPYMFIFITFTVLIYLLIRNHLEEIDNLNIDREYKGYEPLIKKYLVEVLRRGGAKVIPDIHFTEIGKTSRAHKLAIKTYRKQIKPTMVINAKEVIEWII